MVRYQVVVDKDDETTLNIGNTAGDTDDVNQISITSNGRIKIAKIILSNLNNKYDNEFTTENPIDVHLKNDDSVSALFHRFTGEVLEVQPNRDNTRVTLICKDVNNRLAERVITGNWTNIDLGLLIYNVITEKLPEIDASSINQTTGIIIDEVRVEARYINDFFDDIFRENNYDFFIDNDLIARLFNTNQGVSGITLSDGVGGNVIDGTQNLKNSNLTRKNTVTVIGGTETDNQEDNFVYLGQGTTFVLRQPIKLGTTPVVEIEGSPSGVTFTVSSDGRVVDITSSLSIDDTVDIAYDFESQVWWKESVLGTTNEKEVVIKDDTIITVARARSLSEQTITKLNTKILKGSASATNINTDFLWFETLELDTVSGFSGTQIIKGYTETITDTYVVNFNLSELLDANTRKLFEAFKEIDKLKDTGEDALIRDGFTIFDIIDDDEVVTATVQGIGTRWIFDHPTNSAMDDNKTMDTYGTTPVNQPL